MFRKNTQFKPYEAKFFGRVMAATFVGVLTLQAAIEIATKEKTPVLAPFSSEEHEDNELETPEISEVPSANQKPVKTNTKITCEHINPEDWYSRSPDLHPEVAKAIGMDPENLTSIEYGVLSCLPKISQEDIYSNRFVVKAGNRLLHCLVLRGDMLLMGEHEGGPQSFVFAACPELKIDDPY